MFRHSLVAVALVAAFAPAYAHDEEKPRAKNVIFFLGDGMGPVTSTAARIYKVKEDGSLTMDKLPYTARVKTYSLDAQTTDSAPSMAAYMTGVKTRNDVLAMNADTVALPYKPTAVVVTNADGTKSSIPSAQDNCPATGNGAASTTLLELAIAKGKSTGVVTTARLTHATPAATYAHVCHRDAEYTIAAQAVPGGANFNPALGKGVDVLMGGVSYYWRPFDRKSTPRGRPDGRNLVAELQANGYTFVNDLATMTAAPAERQSKIIGLFDFAQTEGHMSYDLDRDPAKEPSLAQMTSKAIDVLSKNEAGFFLMVEGGRIDHALHGTNARRALQDTIAFDEAIQAAIDKMRKVDPKFSNTLIVVTADHDHTIAFNGYGKRGTDILGLNINYATGQPSTDINGNPYTTLVFGNGANRPNVRGPLDPKVVAGADYLQEVAVRRGGPGSETHGGGDVAVYAGGAGSRRFKGTIDNTRVFDLVKSAAGY